MTSLRMPLAAVAFAVGATMACSHVEAPTSAAPPPAIRLAAPQSLPDGTVLPKGTVLSEARDASGRPFVHFALPEGYKLVSASRSGTGDVQLFDGGGLTCTCDEGSGCSPFVAQGPRGEVTGCALSSGCTRCTAEVAASMAGATGEIILGSDQEVDILHVAAGVSFITDPEELEALSCPRGVVLRHDGFTQGVAKFLDGFQIADRDAARRATSRAELPDGYTMMFINAYGKAMRVPIQRGVTISEVVARNTFLLRGGNTGEPTVSARVAASGDAGTDGATTCTCLSGSSGCEYKRQRAWPLGYAEWCEAGGCTSCRIDTSNEQ